MTSTSDASVDWSAVEWVILDMDGTILDLAYDNYFWGQLLPERYADLHGLELAQAIAALRPHFESLRHTLPWYCTDHWSQLTGLNVAALKHEVRARIRPIDGAIDFLDAVRASGRHLWLATNAHGDSWRLKLGETGIADRFEQIVCSHDLGAPKEDQRFWTALDAAHPFDRRRALFVDDSEPVLRAAQQFGIGQIVGIRRPDSGQQERVFNDLASIPALASLTPSLRAASAAT